MSHGFWLSCFFLPDALAIIIVSSFCNPPFEGWPLQHHICLLSLLLYTTAERAIHQCPIWHHPISPKNNLPPWATPPAAALLFPVAVGDTFSHVRPSLTDTHTHSTLSFTKPWELFGRRTALTRPNCVPKARTAVFSTTPPQASRFYDPHPSSPHTLNPSLSTHTRGTLYFHTTRLTSSSPFPPRPCFG